VVFRCWCCNERFATFHPAYEPPEWLAREMELLKAGGAGVALCNVAVASWDELPPLECSEEEVLIAQSYTGKCRVCQVDIDEQYRAQPDEERAVIVPKRSYLNNMDPCWYFPHELLGQLFAHATVTEATLVALEHMQVNFVTVRRTRLHKFHKNVISFPQDSASFLARMGALLQFREGDRVNSVRGPGMDPQRRSRRADDPDTTQEERERFAVDESGCLVFPATVKRVLPDGSLLVVYDKGLGEGLELPEHVAARVQMPWHPATLKGILTIFLRRNLGYGKVLEGLEVRWGYVSKLVQALAHVGPYRLDGSGGPMHRWYDPRLFDLLSELEIRERYAPKVFQGEYVSAEEARELRGQGHLVDSVDVQRPEEMVEAGFDLRYVGSEADAAEEVDAVEQDAF
jgi:hypothetical protein